MEACPLVTDVDDDVRLMLAFRDGDGAAFDELFARWAAPLLRYLQRMVGDMGSAEELVQEVFLRVHRSKERYSPDARFSTWLYRIATNLALNELRRPRSRAIHQSTEDEGARRLRDTKAGPDQAAHLRRFTESVELGLRQLPAKQRAAICLAVVEGHSYAEVAATMDISVQAVKALVHRARSALAAKLPGREY
jgi:RNA polymerase sigma-70 factor (ECF subfamily)